MSNVVLDIKSQNSRLQEEVANKFDGVREVKSFKRSCHPEDTEGSLTCPPYSYGRRGFFAEFTLSRLFRFFTAFRMTRGEGLRMTLYVRLLPVGNI